jgi:hypothetical protein
MFTSDGFEVITPHLVMTLRSEDQTSTIYNELCISTWNSILKHDLEDFLSLFLKFLTENILYCLVSTSIKLWPCDATIFFFMYFNSTDILDILVLTIVPYQNRNHDVNQDVCKFWLFENLCVMQLM